MAFICAVLELASQPVAREPAMATVFLNAGLRLSAAVPLGNAHDEPGR